MLPGSKMRTAILLSLFVILSAPDFARDPLPAQEVARFIAAAEEMAARPDLPSIHAPGQLPALAAAAPDVLDHHGFNAQRWRVIGQRILAAYQMERRGGAPLDAAKAATRLAADRSLTPEQRSEMMALVRLQRTDLAVLAAETEKDRAAVVPFMTKLDLLMQP